MRSFKQAVNQDGHQFNLHPGDYTLFVLATWNEETGAFDPLIAPDNLGTATEHLEPDGPPAQEFLR